LFNIRAINDTISIGLLDLKAFGEEMKNGSARENEKMGTGFLLNKMLNTYKNELSYTSNKEPYLVGRKEQISISHSHDKLAIIVDQMKKTGIDIELIRDKVKKIQHKFLNAAEIKIANNETETLISFWAIKETLYKIYGLKEVDFIKHLFVTEYGGSNITGRIAINGQEKNYKLAKETLDDYIMIYALDEI